MKTLAAASLTLLARLRRCRADGPPTSFPFGPTTATPIEVHYLSTAMRAASTPSTRDGPRRERHLRHRARSAVRARAADSDRREGELPEAAAGRRVSRRDSAWGNAVLRGRRSEFVVRNAGPKPFEVHPFARRHRHAAAHAHERHHVRHADCSDVTVRVDGRVVTLEVARRRRDLVHRAGSRERTRRRDACRSRDFVVISPARALLLRRIDDPSAFERILFPVLFYADGAYGSQWRTEATVVESSAVVPCTRTRRLPSSSAPCRRADCDPRFEPKSIEQYDGYPRGTVMSCAAPRGAGSRVGAAHS